MTSVRLMKGEPNTGKPGEWLKFIWATNDTCKDRGMRQISQFTVHLGPWWAGGFVEEYVDFRVIHRTDPTVSIVGTTPYGDEIIVETAKRLNLVYQG